MFMLNAIYVNANVISLQFPKGLKHIFQNNYIKCKLSKIVQCSCKSG